MVKRLSFFWSEIVFIIAGLLRAFVTLKAGNTMYNVEHLPSYFDLETSFRGESYGTDVWRTLFWETLSFAKGRELSSCPHVIPYSPFEHHLLELSWEDFASTSICLAALVPSESQRRLVGGLRQSTVWTSLVVINGTCIYSLRKSDPEQCCSVFLVHISSWFLLDKRLLFPPFPKVPQRNFVLA